MVDISTANRTVCESRLIMLIFALIGAALICWVAAYDFEFSRNRAKEPVMALFGAFMTIFFGAHTLFPNRIAVDSGGISVKSPFAGRRKFSFGEVDGFFDKWPRGIGINLKRPEKEGFRRWGGMHPQEVVVSGMWRRQSDLIASLNELLDAHSSNSISQ